MTPLLREITAVSRLELAEIRRSRWILFAGGVYLVLAGGFVLVGLRESTVLGFTGMGRALMSFSHALLLALPLLALSATGQVIPRARDDGSLELFFGHPVSRAGYFTAIGLTRYLALLLPYLISVLGMALFGRVIFGQAIPWGVLGRAALTGAALLWSFVAIGLAISAGVRSQARAATYVLVAWAAAVALVDFALIGAMLRWHLTPQAVFLLAAANPVQAARMGLLSGVNPELSVLGPVGFYLATELGQGALYALGVLWPLALGWLSFFGALRLFQRRDLV